MDQQKIVPQSQAEDDEIHLVDILRVFIKRRRLIASTIVGITLASLGLGLCLPSKFEASATLMPIEAKSDGLANALGALGGGLGGMIAAQAGIGAAASEKFVTILKSRTLGNSVITKLELLPVFFNEQWDTENHTWKKPVRWGPFVRYESAPTFLEGYQVLNKMLSVSTDQTGVISIQVRASDPELSARIANAFVGELEAYLKVNALSTAKRNRVFVEKQLQDVQKGLSKLEVDLKDFQTEHKLVSLDAQTEAAVSTYATLKSQLISKEVQLEVLENSGIWDEVARNAVQKEITGLKSQLQKLESGSSAGPTISFKDAPGLGLKFAQIQRDLLVKQKVFELLVQQYELAKIQESKEDISFQLIDSAVPPDEKSSPKLLLIVLLGFIASVMVGVFLAFGLEFWESNRAELKLLNHQLRKGSEPNKVA